MNSKIQSVASTNLEYIPNKKNICLNPDFKIVKVMLYLLLCNY